mmetsp:Transcript_9091/g.13552  ORF Transcript_9091/g.13552 Transcript_9091/m.13552 type:complete len:177 (-) Transcript_9091:38-568(-)
MSESESEKASSEEEEDSRGSEEEDSQGSEEEDSQNSEEGSEEESQASQKSEEDQESQGDQESDVEEQPLPTPSRPKPSPIKLVQEISSQLDRMSLEIDEIFSFKVECPREPSFQQLQSPEPVFSSTTMSFPKPPVEEAQLSQLYQKSVPDEPISLVKESKPSKFFSFNSAPYYQKK